jgi:hypothetical protein
MKFLLLFVFIVSSTADSFSQSKRIFEQLNALKGLWKMQTSDGTMYEEWKVGSNRLFIAKSYKVKGTDTTLLENVKLLLKKNIISYNVTVPDQHDGQSVSFKLITKTKKTFTFENKFNDFPQRIIYNIVNADSLHARIEGTNKNQPMSLDFNFTRVK